jgi:hypothetical protein
MFRISVYFACVWLAGMALPLGAQEPRPSCPEGSVFDVGTGSCRSGQHVATMRRQADKPHLVLERKTPTSATAYELHLIETRDGIYLPLGVRKPAGSGPFPAILMGSGNGHGGFTRVENAMYRLEPMMDEMIARGYLVAFGNYRHEIPEAYNQFDDYGFLADDISGGARALASAPALDHHDYISLIEHLQALPHVSNVGTIGVSHSGELQAKAAAEITWGAAVPIEGAVHEFLPVDYSRAPRKDRVMQLQDPEFTATLIDKAKAMERIRRIKTPFLHLGRDGDHLQGLFVLNHRWMQEAGVNSTWMSAAHDVHGYGFLYRNDDGSYNPDKMQREFFEHWMAFFDKHLQKAQTANPVQ